MVREVVPGRVVKVHSSATSGEGMSMTEWSFRKAQQKVTWSTWKKLEATKAGVDPK